MQKPVDNQSLPPKRGKSVQGEITSLAADPIPLPLTFGGGAVGSVEAEDSTSLSFLTNGVKRAKVTPTGLEIVPSGSAATPSLRIGSSCGLYTSSGDLSCSSNGTRGAFLTNTAFTASRFNSPYSQPSKKPRYAFIEEPTTGLASDSSSDLSVIVQNNEVLKVTSGATQFYSPLALISGTKVVPSLVSTAQPYNGLYYEADDTVSMAIEEEELWKVAPTSVTLGKQVILPAGSVSAPSLSINGDSNTGAYLASTGTVGMTAGGTQVAQFQPTKAHFPQGIALGAVGTDILSIYQTGTGAPTLTATNFTFAGTGVTQWIRIGSIVFVQGSYTWTSISGAGTTSILNFSNILPFTTNTVVHSTYLKNNASGDITIDGNGVIVCQANVTGGQMAALTTAGAWSPGFTASNFAASGGFRFTFRYNVT